MSNFSERLQRHGRTKILAVWDDFRKAVNDAAEAEESSGRAPTHKDRCKTWEGHPATLTRWLQGNSKPCPACVGVLADLLHDPGLVSARDADGDGKAELNERYIVSRARQLSKPALIRVITELLPEGLTDRQRNDFVRGLNDPPATEFSTRSAFELRIHLARLDETMLRGRATVSWRGDIPAGANIQAVSHSDDLSVAFNDERCIYRDAIFLNEAQLQAGFARLQKPPRLRITRAGSQAIELVAVDSATPGRFEFENEEIKNGNFRLEFVFPYAPTYQSYPVQFGSYGVMGVAHIVMEVGQALASGPPLHHSSVPRSYYSSADTDAYRLALDLGDQDTMLPENTTVWFSWSRA